jgi:hypothetical protein
MCDFSLQAVKSRPAVVGEELITTDFGTGSRGFGSASDPNPFKTAVCLLPGTELAFAQGVKMRFARDVDTFDAVAIFRQVDLDNPRTHHDCLEFPDGSKAMLTYLVEGQRATVLQLPAAPKTAEEAKAQERAAFVG